MACWKTMTAAAIGLEQVPVRNVSGHSAKHLQVPRTAGFAKSFDEGDAEERKKY
jgi:hypothetical protein